MSGEQGDGRRRLATSQLGALGALGAGAIGGIHSNAAHAWGLGVVVASNHGVAVHAPACGSVVWWSAPACEVFPKYSQFTTKVQGLGLHRDNNTTIKRKPPLLRTGTPGVLLGW